MPVRRKPGTSGWSEPVSSLVALPVNRKMNVFPKISNHVIIMAQNRLISRLAHSRIISTFSQLVFSFGDIWQELPNYKKIIEKRRPPRCHIRSMPWHSSSKTTYTDQRFSSWRAWTNGCPENVMSEGVNFLANVKKNREKSEICQDY